MKKHKNVYTLCEVLKFRPVFKIHKQKQLTKATDNILYNIITIHIVYIIMLKYIQLCIIVILCIYCYGVLLKSLY